MGRPWHRDRMQGMGEIQPTSPPCCVAADADRVGRTRHQPVLRRFRAHSGSLTRAAFLSARNDALANVAIIAAGSVTAVVVSPWPDLFVGIGIFAMNLDASRQVYVAARDERRAVFVEP